LLYIAEAIRKKINLKRIFNLSKVDPWFLNQIKEIVDTENKIKSKGLPKEFNEFNRIKSIGFSDKKLAELTNTSEQIVRQKRTALKILPVYKKGRYLCCRI
jgi:carbamoyl-phosphate synthase large subunit